MATKADYQISSLVNDGILEIRLSGEFRRGSLEEIKSEIVHIEKSVDTKRELIDVQRVKGYPSITEIYTFARSLPSDRHRMKTAIVDAGVNDDLKSFLEDTTFNVGQSFKCFTDIDAARAWLKSK